MRTLGDSQPEASPFIFRGCTSSQDYGVSVAGVGRGRDAINLGELKPTSFHEPFIVKEQSDWTSIAPSGRNANAGGICLREYMLIEY